MSARRRRNLEQAPPADAPVTVGEVVAPAAEAAPVSATTQFAASRQVTGRSRAAGRTAGRAVQARRRSAACDRRDGRSGVDRLPMRRRSRSAQEALAREPKPVHVPREPRPVVLVDESAGARRDAQGSVSQYKLPFETATSNDRPPRPAAAGRATAAAPARAGKRRGASDRPRPAAASEQQRQPAPRRQVGQPAALRACPASPAAVRRQPRLRRPTGCAAAPCRNRPRAPRPPPRCQVIAAPSGRAPSHTQVVAEHGAGKTDSLAQDLPEPARRRTRPAGNRPG